MKKLILLFMVFFAILFTASFVLADDEPASDPVPMEIVDIEDVPEGSAITDVDKTKPDTESAIWEFLNSKVGVTMVGFLLTVILGKIFTKKPKWKQYVLQYGPKLMQAVKSAEKNIPDDTDNKALARLNNACQYIIEIEPALSKALKADLEQALTAVHAKAESGGNLK